MQRLALLALGIALSTLQIWATGLLSIQFRAVRGGAVVAPSNELVSVTEPRFGLVAYVVLGLVHTGVILFFTVGVDRLPDAAPLRGGFIGSSLAQLGLVFALQWVDPQASDLFEPPPAWIEGWVTRGVLDPIVLATALLCLVAPVVRRIRAKRPESADGSCPPGTSRRLRQIAERIG